MTTIKEFVSPLVPILKDGRVECTYALRMTPLGKYVFYDLQNFLKTFDDYICAQEQSKKNKEHYHIILFTKMYEEEVREKIREFLNKYFTDPPKRGDANKQYNLSETNDLAMSITYILKDGGEITLSENINDAYLDTLKKKSYKKYSKEDFAKSLEVLKTKFKDEDPKIGDMMESVVKLKALYRQPINMTHIYQMCVSFRVHNDPTRSAEYVQNFLSRQL